jgi:hypothetical protein
MDHTGETPNRRISGLFPRIMPFVVCGLLITSCGEKPSGGTPTPEPVSYGWTLPTIDTATDGADGEIYQALQKSCDDGDAALAAKWQQSSSPRDVLLFAAGVQACRGAMAQARTLYQRAKDEYGWSGLGPAQSDARCDVYKSVASMIENAPRDRFPCPDGASPDFKRSPSGVLDDPRTPQDESAVVAVTTTPTSTTAPPAPTSRNTRTNNTVVARTSTRTPTLTNNNVVTRTSKSASSGGGSSSSTKSGGTGNSGNSKSSKSSKSNSKGKSNKNSNSGANTDMNTNPDMNTSPSSKTSKSSKTKMGSDAIEQQNAEPAAP